MKNKIKTENTLVNSKRTKFLFYTILKFLPSTRRSMIYERIFYGDAIQKGKLYIHLKKLQKKNNW